MKMKKVEILFPIFLYILTIYALTIISKNPVVGYEISIYDSSFKELIILIISSLGGIIYLYFINKEKKFLVTMALILILMNNFIILSLPELRGYIIQGDIDSLTHIGYMKDIINNGYLNKYSNNLIYPISHILIINVNLLANISLIQMATYISPIFSILYVIYIYLLSKKLSDNKEQTILIILSSITFLFLGFEAELKPQFLSLISIPLFLYFLFSKQLFGIRLILIMLVILIQFFHPLTSLFFIVGISLMILYSSIRTKYVNFIKYNDYKNLLSIGMISFILWVYNFRMLNYEVIGIYNLIKGHFSSPINNVQSSFVKLNLTKSEIVEIFIRMYGHNLIFIIITLIFIIYYLKKEIKDPKKDLIIAMFVLFISGIILQILIIGGGIALAIFRGLNYVVVLTPIFVGSFLYKIKNNFIKRKIIIGTIILSIISISWLIGTFDIFSSPYIKKPTDQVTKTDIYGADWLFKYKNPNTNYLGGHVYIRFSHLILGVDANNIRKSDPTHWEYMLPDHFNYDKMNRLGENFTENMYMPISIYDKLLYTVGPWKPVARFTNEDFDNLNHDNTVNNLYDNGAMNIYYIKSFMVNKKINKSIKKSKIYNEESIRLDNNNGVKFKIDLTGRNMQE